jgi:hypothetical protein
MFSLTDSVFRVGQYLVLLTLIFICVRPSVAHSADFIFHGDFSHSVRLFSNQAQFFAGDFGYKTSRTAAIGADTSNDTFALLKYRLWAESLSEGGAVKGVYAIEVGNVHFGGVNGGSFSGDGINVETRWAYTELNIDYGQLRLGLQPVKINKFFWQETAAGVRYRIGSFEVAWYRGYEEISDDSASHDLEGFYLRYGFRPVAQVKIGLFATWMTSDGLTYTDVAALDGAGKAVPVIAGNYLKKMTGYDLDIYTFGVDGGLKNDGLFVNWDLMLQSGKLAEEKDFGGYFLHLDVGTTFASSKLTYTFWYSSGDDDSTDQKLDAFIAIDCDTKASMSSVVLFEGFTEDTYFSAVPYIQDKGLILNRIGYEYSVSDKLGVGVAALYLMTAEDVEYDQFSDDKIGFELDCFAIYRLFNNLKFSIEAGYLFADDAMDYYESDNNGKADTDLYVVNSKLAYNF